MAPLYIRRTLKSAAGVIGVAAAAYAAYVGTVWLRYGHAATATGDDVDPLLDDVMPRYDVVERHHVAVGAPAEITFAAACEQDLMALRSEERRVGKECRS